MIHSFLLQILWGSFYKSIWEFRLLNLFSPWLLSTYFFPMEWMIIFFQYIVTKVKYKQKHFSPNFHWYHNKNCLMVSKSLLLDITLLLFWHFLSQVYSFHLQLDSANTDEACLWFLWAAAGLNSENHEWSMKSIKPINIRDFSLFICYL